MTMNKRLVWNFEINTENPVALPQAHHFIETPNRWESRFFWPNNEVITLRGLNHNFLNLSEAQIKHRSDTYYVLPNTDYNLKLRHDQLLYKPILMKKSIAIAYGKKIKLEASVPGLELPGCDTHNVAALIAHIKDHAVKINIEKEALIFRFDTAPISKLELAWLTVANESYFSASIESRAFSIVESLTQQLIGDMPTSDYVTFLQGIT